MSFMRIRETRKIGICGAIVLAAISFGNSSAFAADAETAVALNAPVTQAPARTGPVYGYVGRADKAALRQITPATAATHSAGLLPAIAEAAVGSMIDNYGVDANPAIQDSSEDLARALAGGLADAQGGLLAEGPIPRDQWRAPGKQDATRAMGARYVVAVAPVTMTLGYFALDWGHYDVMLNTTAQVIDTADGRVVSKARCLIKQEYSGPLAGRRDLLANHAEKLQARIAVKTSACLAKLQTDLHLPVSNSRLPTAPTLASNPATPHGGPGLELIADASPACDADKKRYAAEIGVSCDALGARVEFTLTPGQTAELQAKGLDDRAITSRAPTHAEF
jgi:hypothetical protein